MARAAWREGLYSTWLALSQQQEWTGEPSEQARQALKNEALLTISADLPLLTPHDILELVDLSQRFEVVLAGSSDNTGTNALLVHPPLVLR